MDMDMDLIMEMFMGVFDGGKNQELKAARLNDGCNFRRSSGTPKSDK